MIFKNSKLLLTILSLVSVVLLATLTLGVYSIRAKNQVVFELLNLVDHAAEAEILARSIRAVQNDAKGDIEAFNNFVFSDDKLVLLIENIEEAGQTLGLDTKIVSVSKIEDKKAVVPDIVRIVMETQGSWAPTLSFFRAIESLPYRVMIDESSLSRVEVGRRLDGVGLLPDEVGWHSRIVLSLYLFD